MREGDREAAQKVVAVFGEAALEGDAHTLLMAVYRDTRQLIELRVEAARAAIGYEKPRLSSVDSPIEGQVTLEDPRTLGRALHVLQAKLRARKEFIKRGERSARQALMWKHAPGRLIARKNRGLQRGKSHGCRVFGKADYQFGDIST